MPLSRVPTSPDLERVVQVLGGRVAERGVPATPGGGWVPRRPAGTAPAPGAEQQSPRAPKGAHPQPDPDSLGALGELVDLGADDSGARGRSAEHLEAALRRARRPGLLTVPASIRSGRVAVPSSAIVAVLALVVALGCAFAVRVLWAERAAEARLAADHAVRVDPGEGQVGSGDPAVASQSTPAAGQPSGAASLPPGTAGGIGSTDARAEVVVHVVGQVKRPGLVRLRGGARVADALEAAGGASRGADLAALNLARLVVDGEQVFVPRPGEPVPVAGQGSVLGAPAAGGGAAGGGAGAGPVNLNTADLAALDTLPGVGPVLAQRIVDWRTEHGRFSSVEELGEVSGIGDKMLSQLRPKVTV
ncbi:helix-hairpin-helix domain-containing protein [Intrasporangium calvum]|uniref:Helix-hairpin-helix domain-containing protein n=1 Tax=Intrasporangium calvum TaxID=53358 RepID=A0ABT5GLB9_9MICO|nr:helix-hairpin-helix domain-containing protein [Intrasporangium calvum]MDC5698665.1 helix-hairpin-helix domain-containing protein [Intrasporangium calvum]